MRLNGIDAELLLNREQVKEIIPMADFSENVRFPIFGGLMQPSAGTARHDAVAWGYARQADSMGVDIIQNCEVTGFDVVRWQNRMVFELLEEILKLKKLVYVLLEVLIF